jgi:hypothetical protein
MNTFTLPSSIDSQKNLSDITSTSIIELLCSRERQAGGIAQLLAPTLAAARFFTRFKEFQ